MSHSLDCPTCGGTLPHGMNKPMAEVCPEAHERMLARHRDGTVARRLADKLERGEQLPWLSDHHAGMAELKARLGEPRPRGMELSLVDYWGPDSYWGKNSNTGRRYRMSTSPTAYVW